MNKELPKMYHTKINKHINNIQKVYSSINTEDNTNNIINNHIYDTKSIDKKINEIFNSNDYVYKADVTIITDTETLHKRIIARNRNNLITIDNEYIPISIIRNIYK